MTAATPSSARSLVALDIDGTILREDGSVGEGTLSEIARVIELGNEVMLATGRSVSLTLPIVDRLDIRPQYIVCANGAITLRRDPDAPLGYTADHVEVFDPREVLTTIRDHLGEVSFAVEDASGVFRFTGAFPDGSLGDSRQQVDFDELLLVEATRVVVLSPDHEIEDFLSVVERMGLHQVSYNVGWTAWLDIAPDGVNKATGLERVRGILDIPRDRVVVMGDGRNDIDMLQWAAAGGGSAVAMGQAPDEVRAAGNDVTATDIDDGVAVALARLFPS